MPCTNVPISGSQTPCLGGRVGNSSLETTWCWLVPPRRDSTSAGECKLELMLRLDIEDESIA